MRLWKRTLLLYLAFQSSLLGAWALFAPEAFYDNFPGAGRSWVSVDGPFNEHLIRDVGALSLALTVLLVGAAIYLSRELIVTASLASLTWSVPHAIYHAFNTDDLVGSDIALSIGGLVFAAVLPVVLLTMESFSTKLGKGS